MKLLHVITGLPKAAGTSVFCGEVCNGLARAGHDVTLAVCDPGETIDRYPLDARVKLVSITSLFQAGGYGEFEVVHVHAIWTPILHKVSAWATRNNMPVVWSPHGMLAPWAMRHKWWKKCLPWHLYQKKDLKRAKMLHATSEQEEKWIRDLGFTQPITVAPLGTQLPDLKPRVAREGKVLLFVGRIYPVKALDRLIQAFAMVPLEVRRVWRLRLVGPDQAGHMKSLELIVKSLKLEGCVEFTGPRFGEELNTEYDSCDCLALVSHTENFGATVVDAMAHGKPVITGDKTPWREVTERKCGWWVSNDPEKLSAAIGEMMAMSDDERRQMGKNGRRLVEETYTWDAVVKAMVKGYLLVISG
jgi:glycosyltransferase involved in cell wall biosynthesis